MSTEEGARTLDHWIHNPVLYQLSYLGMETKHNILRYQKSEAIESINACPSARRRADDLRVSFAVDCDHNQRVIKGENSKWLPHETLRAERPVEITISKGLPMQSKNIVGGC
jgi:hypothetical protein